MENDRNSEEREKPEEMFKMRSAFRISKKEIKSAKNIGSMIKTNKDYIGEQKQKNTC
jgi:hypothetical protein